MYCYTKKQRLLKKSDFDYVFERAKKLVVSDFTFLYRSNTVGCARLGLVISKKIIAKAHQRNKVKRMIRESFRLQQSTFSSFDVIVLVRKGIDLNDKKSKKQQLEEAWRKIAKLNVA